MSLGAGTSGPSGPAFRATFARAATAFTLATVSAHAAALSPEQVLQAAGASIVRVAMVDAEGRPIRQGSGVVIRPNDVVVNCNVVAGAAAALAVFRDAKWALAQLVGTDRQRNLCHVRWRGDEAIGQPVKGLVAMENVRKGQVVYAVGAPRGLELGLSSGLVAGFVRHPERGMVIQTQAPIANESSGGGLFDRDARLIGFTPAVLKDDLMLDFAVPASAAFDLVAGSRTRRVVPAAPSAKDARTDLDHHARLLSEAARLAQARKTLDEERARLERESVQAEEEQRRKLEAPSVADAPPAVSPETATDAPGAGKGDGPGAPVAADLSSARLQVMSDLIEKALAGSAIAHRAYSVDLSLGLDPEGRLTKLVVDRTSGDRAVDNVVTARITKAAPYRDPAGQVGDGPQTYSLRVGWFHDHPTVIAMFGTLPPYAGSPSAPSPTTGEPLRPDGETERVARELAQEQRRAAEEQRRLQAKAEAENLVREKEEEQRAKRESAEAEARAALAAAASAQRVLNDFEIRLREAIGERFLIPPSAPSATRAEIDIRVLPNGNVEWVRFFKASGVQAFDRAIEQAIERARPLPVPKDPAIFMQFRDQRLVFTGER